MPGEDEPVAAATLSLPISDLFLALGATLLLAIVPLAQRSAETPLAALEAGRLTIDGALPVIVIADAAGLLVRDGGVAERRIGRDALPMEPALAALLGRARGSRRPVLLLLADDGQESAFLFEAAVSRAGIAPLYQIRLDDGCVFLRPSVRPSRCPPPERRR